MGLILGLDFGTTYSALSMKDETDGKIKPCEYDGETMIEDSLVFLADGSDSLEFGELARNKAGSEGTLYSGFKMMLYEDDVKLLKEQNYSSKVTPKYVTKHFLDDLLQRCMESYSTDRIEKLVVGVPDIWDKKTKRNDNENSLHKNRNILLKVIQSLGYVDDVELYSEPELASAYYLDNYKRQANGESYSGYLLLVDYGGGTLDVAICESNGKKNNNVRVLKTFGEGWNEQGKKGDAGLAFMRRLVEISVKEANQAVDELKILECQYKLEKALKKISITKLRELKSVFANGSIEQVAKSRRASISFDKLKYGETNIDVTYKMMADAYIQIIQPVIKRVLESTVKYLKEKGIDYSISNKNQHFKIQLVGGFSNFYLVEKSVEEVLGRDENDIRFQGGFTNKNDKNYAVSYGAALVANQDISITRTARYAVGLIGIEGKLDNGKHKYINYPYFATRIDDEIVPEKVYLVNLSNGEPKIFIGNNIAYFAFSSDPELRNENIQALKPTDEYSQMLRIQDSASRYIIGISFNKSLVITIHKWRLSDNGEKLLNGYKNYKKSHKPQTDFVDELTENNEKYGVSFEGCELLDEIFTLTGVPLT